MSNEIENAGPKSIVTDESPTLGALAAALAKAQGAMKPAKKDSENPHFRSKFADLASIREVAREPLAANGLAVMQRLTSTGTSVFITTHLIHASGEWVKDRCEWPVAQRTPQAMGSAITYGKRYAYSALLGIVAEEDDDGNAASAPNGNTSSNGYHQAPKPTPAAKSSGPDAAERAIVSIREAQTLADLGGLTKKITELGVSKDKAVRDEYAKRQNELKNGAEAAHAS